MVTVAQQVPSQNCRGCKPNSSPITCATPCLQVGLVIRRYTSNYSAGRTLESIIQLERRTFSKALRLGGDGFARKASQRNCLILYAVQTSAPDQVVGYILCTASSLVLGINTVAVDPLHRRKGVATALIQEALRSSKAACATLHVDPRNGCALALYAKLDFALDGVIQDYYAPGCPAQKLMKHLSASA